MATAGKARVEKIRRRTLLRLWDAVREGRPLDDWASGKALEHIVLRAFSLEGAIVTWPYEVTMEALTGNRRAIEQIDGFVSFDHLYFLIEAKDYSDPIDIAAIAKMRNQLLRRPSHLGGIVFAKAGFTSSAKTLARFTAPQMILLWDGDELDYALRQGKMIAGLRAKMRYALEHGYPDYNLLGEQ